MKIWGRANSINVMKVLWCADECGLKYERENVGLQYGGNDQKWYLDMNPNGVVPTIDDGGRIIWESNSCVRYLSAKYAAGTLWPNDPGQRSEADRCGYCQTAKCLLHALGLSCWHAFQTRHQSLTHRK